MIFKMKQLKFSIIILIIFYNTGCDTKREALGADNEIRIICSELDKENIHKYLSAIFIDTIFTPEPEPYYYLKFSTPENYNKLKSQAQVIVAALDRDRNNSGYQLVKRILSPEQFEETEKKNPILLAKDVNAKKQLFMVINANSFEQLMYTVEKNREHIRKQFHDQFIDRQSRFIFGEDRNKKLEDSLNREFGWSLKIPWGWEVIKKLPDSNFVWFGKEMPFQWIGISWLEGNIIEDDLSVGEYLWSWPKKNYHYIQFNNYKFELDKSNYKNYPSWRATGIWETIDPQQSKGGPFRSYLFYDPKQDVSYHVNYLIHHPGHDKSIFMRQLDLIVKSFKIHNT